MDYKLIGPDGKPYLSSSPGTLGGYGPKKIYGTLFCPSALKWIAKGHYAKHRVFFLNEEHALAAGYRPCANCLPEKFRVWKENKGENKGVL